MKNPLKFLLGGLFLTAMLFACKKQENKVLYTGGTAPVLSASSTADQVLIKPNALNTAVVLTWTNPNYQFNTGVSSQDVSYTLQFDTTGSNFTNPNIQEVTVAKELSNTLTVTAINAVLAKLGLKENIPHSVEIRVKSSLVNNSVPLYSNVVKIVMTPYLDVAVTLPQDLPTQGSNNGDLFLVGNATSGGWDNPVPVPSQKFTRTDLTTYEITVPLIGGNQYLFLPKNGDWGHKYACNNTPAGTTANTGGSFGADLSDNFPGPTVSGNYKIVVDFKTGKFTVTKL